MTRDQLQAAIWQTMRAFKVHTDGDTGFVDALIGLADAYSSGDSADVTVMRREILHRETA
jgi:hypothetical protein